MGSIKILVVDDEPLLGRPLQRALEYAGFAVRLAESGAEAMEAIHEERFDILLEDLRLPDADGLDIMMETISRNPGCRALVMTAYGSIELAVEAMRCGADDFLTKPFPMEQLFLKLQRSLDLRGAADGTGQGDGDCSLRGYAVSQSPLMHDLLHKARVAAATSSTVLITGESGTGKEFLADYLHAFSTRREQPFIKVNCAAIPETLFESELFGVEQGAFTGARTSRNGYLEEAAGGTLFLDEIADLPLSVQAKFLRALDEKIVHRVGGSRGKKVDFRLIAATNADLGAMVRQKAFRDDLYYRLNVIPIVLPPLRERREDIPLLIAHFQKSFRKNNNGEGTNFSAEAMNAFLDYHFPGNVRELKNIVEHFSILHPGETIRKRHLLGHLHKRNLAGMIFESMPVDKPLKAAVAEFEKRYIAKVMQSVGGHKARSATLLGLSRKVLWERLNRTV